GADEPWRRDRLGRRRPPAVGDHRAGHERDRGADVAAVPDARGGGGERVKIVFTGARVVDPAAGRDETRDVLVEDGVIANGSASGATEIDCAGLVPAP